MTRRVLVETAEVRSAGGRPYSPAVLAGGWLHVSGQVPIDGDGRTVAPDAAGQLRHCLDNIRVLVEAAGGTLGDVVRLQIFTTNMPDYLACADLRREYFDAPYPATTTVEISSLVQPEWLVEIEATAYLGPA